MIKNSINMNDPPVFMVRNLSNDNQNVINLSNAHYSTGTILNSENMRTSLYSCQQHTFSPPCVGNIPFNTINFNQSHNPDSITDIASPISAYMRRHHPNTYLLSPQDMVRPRSPVILEEGSVLAGRHIRDLQLESSRSMSRSSSFTRLDESQVLLYQSTFINQIEVELLREINYLNNIRKEVEGLKLEVQDRQAQASEFPTSLDIMKLREENNVLQNNIQELIKKVDESNVPLGWLDQAPRSINQNRSNSAPTITTVPVLVSMPTPIISPSSLMIQIPNFSSQPLLKNNLMRVNTEYPAEPQQMNAYIVSDYDFDEERLQNSQTQIQHSISVPTEYYLPQNFPNQNMATISNFLPTNNVSLSENCASRNSTLNASSNEAICLNINMPIACNDVARNQNIQCYNRPQYLSHLPSCFHSEHSQNNLNHRSNNFTESNICDDRQFALDFREDSINNCEQSREINEHQPNNLDSWNCNACTFLNHSSLQQCEMCELPKYLDNLDISN